jgi:hypothetical protein
MNPGVVVHKCNPQGEELWSYPGEILAVDDGSVSIEAFFDRERAEVGLLSLERGDRFVETYYFGRNYNIFKIYAGSTAAIKGWYCNLARPAVLATGHLHAEDLALDLVRLPDGRMQLLDVEEYENLALVEEERITAAWALDQLRWQIYNGQEPFTIQPGS